MILKEFNSLVDLFFYQAEKENPSTDFLEWLNPKNKKKYTWGETSTNIQKLAKVLKDNLAKGDRCLLVSENRPEWLIADLAIIGAAFDGRKTSTISIGMEISSNLATMVSP